MRGLIRAAIAAASLAAASASAGVPFGQFIAFGASYDDSGQFPDLELGGATGLRFTNIDPATGLRGLAMPEWLALDLGLGRMNPSTPLVFLPRTDTVDTDNLNFAVGGYRSEEVLASVTGNSVVSAGGFRVEQPGFLARVASGALAVGPDTLYYALIAGNDIRDVDDPVQTAAVSAQIVQALVDAGARYIVLPTLPKLGDFAESANLAPDGGRTQLAADRSAAAIAYNAAFEQRLNSMEGNFIRVDVLRFFDEVLADPVSFGFPADLDQSRVCYSAESAGGVACVEPEGRGEASGGSPDQFAFQDGLHPTQAAARAAADLMESVIRAPGLVALLPEAVLADTRGHLRTVEEHLAQNRWGDSGAAPQLFVAVQGREIEIDDAWSTPAASSDAVDLTIGASVGLGSGWFVGGAIGSQQGEADIDDAGSGFDSSGLMASAFAAWRCDGWFADLVLSAGQSDLDDIQRVFEIGPAQDRRESGDTEADVLGLSGAVGVDMSDAANAWRAGPFLALDWLDIDVDGYAEGGLSSSTMQYGDLARESLLGSAGIFGSYPLALGAASVELSADVAYVEEFEDDPQDVTAVVKSLATGPSFRMPGYAIDDDGWRATLGASASWQGGLRVGLSYRHTDNEAEAQYLNLSASYAF